MRKLSLLLASLFISANCFADLGEIKVKSYLEQTLNATIPIYNVANNNYSNLSINLASSDVFKSYGVPYDASLGSLLFRVVNQGNVHYLQITSSKPISAPILDILLHYQEDNNDFYRQYTVLLDPITYSNNGYKATSKVVNSRITQIPVTNKKPWLKFTKPASKKTTTQADRLRVKDQFVADHLAQFNKHDMTFTMESGDSLYIPARFLQLIHAKYNFSINQIILALGLANYHNLHDENYIYQSTSVINAPTVKQIASISHKLADSYIWQSDLNKAAKLELLKTVANKFDANLVIESDYDVFNSNGLIVATKKQTESSEKSAPLESGSIKISASEIIVGKVNTSDAVVASAPVKKKPAYQPPIYNEPDLIDQIMDFKMELLGALLAALVLGLVVVKKRSTKPKAKQHSDDNTSKGIEDIIFDKASTTEHQHEKYRAVELDSPSINHPAEDVALDIQKVIPKPKLTSSGSDVAIALEQILSLDPERNDVRLKLFEIYLNSGNTANATEMYTYLNKNLDNDDPLHSNFAHLIDKSGFQVSPVSAINANAKDVEVPAVEVADKVPEVSLTLVDEVRDIDFPHVFDEDKVISNANDDVVSVSQVEKTKDLQVLDQATIAILEQVLMLDDSRNDIRLKLFETYATSQNQELANKYFAELEGNSSDDVINQELSQICSISGFVPEKVVKKEITANDFAAESSEGQAKINQDERILEFTTAASVVAHEPIVKEEISFDNSHVVEFKNTLEDMKDVIIESTLEAQSTKTTEYSLEHHEIEQKMNMATMYYHIEDFMNASRLLKEVIDSEVATKEQKVFAKKMLADYDLND